MIDINSPLYKRWQEKMPEVEMFLNLANSHSNIFLYGATGVGKTSFVQDCLKFKQSMTNERILPYIYVDCVEFFNEKLISNYISLCLDNILKKCYRDNGEIKAIRKYY